ASAQQITDLLVLPFVDVIERTFKDFPLRPLAAIKKCHRDGACPWRMQVDKFGAGHLECAVTY
ncbi:MAG: hypothetical protein ABI618_20475, partial [Nitrospirota bacterium]